MTEIQTDQIQFLVPNETGMSSLSGFTLEFEGSGEYALRFEFTRGKRTRNQSHPMQTNEKSESDVELHNLSLHNFSRDSVVELSGAVSSIQWSNTTLHSITTEQVLKVPSRFSSPVNLERIDVDQLVTNCFLCSDSPSVLSVQVSTSSFRHILPFSSKESTYPGDALWSFTHPENNATLCFTSVLFEEIYARENMVFMKIVTHWFLPLVGIAANPSIATIDSCNFTTISLSSQPAIFVADGQRLEIIDSTFIQCNATLLMTYRVPSIVIHSSTFENNTAPSVGISVSESAIEMSQVTWSFNRAESGENAFGKISAGSTALVHQFAASGNRGYQGGVFYLEASQLTLQDSEMNDNQAKSGGALYMATGTEALISNTTVRFIPFG